MKQVKGSATVEMAYMMPILLLTFVVSIYIIFYLHDKNIVVGATYETAVVGVQKLRWDEQELDKKMKELFFERVNGKLIFFRPELIKLEIGIEKEEVRVRAFVKRKKMAISAEQKIIRVEPEKYIRDLRRVEGVWK